MDSLRYWAWLLLFVTITIVRKVHEGKMNDRHSLDGVSGVEMVLMAAWAALAAVAPFIFFLTDWLAFANYPFEVPGVVAVAGVGLFVAATWLLHVSHRDLGEYWTPRSSPVDGGTLITSGIYAKLRHPMYAAHILWALAQAMILPNYFAGIGGLLPLALLLWIRVRREERELLAAFGTDYCDYAARTGGFFPFTLGGESVRPE